MKSPSPLIFAIAFLSTSARAADPPPDYTKSIADTYIGCFNSAGGLAQVGSRYDFQSTGYCRTTCTGLKKRYSGLSKKFYCYCGDTLPPVDAQVPNSVCNLNCAGYPSDPCGSNSGDYTIFLTDPTEQDSRIYDPNKAPSSSQSQSQSATSSSSTAPTSTFTKKGTFPPICYFING